ncbi:hypothetical protein HanIR_Chr08g0364081 [Helianthus annuus]|nr:hypothetical protein HanIR_Chr08g0364081 [Helianthus annuus]
MIHRFLVFVFVAKRAHNRRNIYFPSSQINYGSQSIQVSSASHNIAFNWHPFAPLEFGQVATSPIRNNSLFHRHNRESITSFNFPKPRVLII